MTSNLKKVVLTISALACSAVLAGCGTIEAKPADSDYEAKILALDGVTNNEMKQIYDAVVTSGDTNSAKVLNNILELYSESIYGSFYDVGTVKGLRTAVSEYEATPSATADIQAIADKYAVYHNADGNGNVAKVVSFYQSLVRRIEASFLSQVTGTTYQVRSKFYEQKFYAAEQANLYELANLSAFKNNVQVDGALKVDETTLGLTDDTLSGVYFTDLFTTYKDYINKALLPDLYRSALIEQYLYENNFGTLGRSNARKVEYVSLADNSAYPTATKNLLEAYAQNVMTAGLDMKVYGFDYLNNLYKGTVASGDAVANKIYSDAGFTSSTITVGGAATSYYAETTVGSYYDSFSKITDSRFTNDSTVYKDFTNSGAYSVLTGLLVKKQALDAVDSTVNGWYTTSDLDSLPSAMKTRLFKVNVANDVDANKSADEEMDYGWYVKGHYYLTPDTYEVGAAYPYIMHDSSTSKWYVVKVDEAVKSGKLASTGDSSYSTTRTDPLFTEKVAREIAYSLSGTDTYKSTANQYYVDKMAIGYNDQYVYDYFKTTFPDLFD